MMKTSTLSVALLVALTACGTLAACGSAPTPEVTPPPPSATQAAPVASASASATATATVQNTPPAAPEPTPAEKAKAKAAAMLEKDRAKAAAEQIAELARWTPELHAAVKPLAEKAYPTGHAAMLAVVAGKHRRPASPERDHDRHPVETFDFYGLQPNMTVLEFAPGEAWFTELLAPALAKRGKLICTSTDPNGPKEERTTFYGQRFKDFLSRSPEVFGKVETLIIQPTAPKLGLEGTVDMVLMMRALHGVVNAGKLDVWLGEAYKALKPKGILAVEQHRAPADAKPEESAKNGYLPEAWVIERIEAAGFKLVAKSEINANPKDTKDHPEGVWTLPPTYRLGDTDHAKYAAIGESDRMTLRFVKVTPPAAKK
jgi:predicted methyltransferase